MKEEEPERNGEDSDTQLQRRTDNKVDLETDVKI